MVALPGYILAGGRSSRFGSDKARATLDGVPLVCRIARVMREFGSKITIVAEVPNKYEDLRLRTIADRLPGKGPLAGLDAALSDAASFGSEWLLLTSCDLLDLNASWLERLSSQRDPSADFVAFRGERWEPLIACYRTTLISRVADHLRKDISAMWKLLEASRGRALDLPADWPDRVQANTPAELEAARTHDKLQRTGMARGG